MKIFGPCKQTIQFQPPVIQQPVPRNVRILKEDVDRHGATPNCPGCRAIVANKPWRAAHSGACRQRMEKLLADDEDTGGRVERAAERITHHIVDHSEHAEEEESDKKRQKPNVGTPLNLSQGETTKWQLRIPSRRS